MRSHGTKTGNGIERKGNFVSDHDRQEFREYLQFCIEGLKAGMTEDEIFAAWLAGEASVPKAG